MAAPIGGHWGDLRTRSVWRWQLIVAASTVAIIAMVPLLSPQLFSNARFLSGAIGIAAITALSLLVPWHLAAPAVITVVPLLDIVAIGQLSVGGDTSLALLWVFPIAWLATYYRFPWLIAALSLIAVILLIDATFSGLSPAFAQRTVVMLMSLGFLGVTIMVGAQRTRAYSHLLRRQFAQLDRTRRRAEHDAQRIAVLSNTLETAIARIDRDGVLLDANAAFLHLYAAADIDTFTPTGAVEYRGYRGEPVDPDSTLIARARRGERFYDHRVWLFDAQGRWRALDASSRPVPGSDEQPSNLILAQDVTDAVRADEQRQTVSSVVTHELRNPLTAIVGHSDLLLERDDLPAGVREQIAQIDSAGQRMQRLITSALEPYGQAVAEEAHVDLGHLVTASVVAFQPTAEAARVDLSCSLDGTADVGGDAFRLRQAIDNVVGNALKYTARGGTVEVSVRAQAHEGVIVVTDTGIGMSPNDRDRIFETGFRSATARASGISGSGIGMSVVHDIVTAHGGSLDVVSELGRGTCVTVRLPCAADVGDPGATIGHIGANNAAERTST
ncbi:sensor histidine kinase [Microbacterium invictum]|uniref:histidine kinase n=1 Tax=Microbacterium invictum TaxID=515415 RepID=A0AA40VMU7_9MICO|nr:MULTISPECIES: PAS domain-containing sensor histidine kinase [Microbacterium]MBB4140074.1 signal transduction histidine kinase [Microbacterium invictum]